MELREFYRISSAYYDADYAAKGYCEDVAFYVDMAVASGGPVLEMGCGTGRILLPTARAGIHVHGLEMSPEMLSRLRESLAGEPAEVQQRVSLSEGDMRHTQVPGSFALVTAPFRVAQHLLEREDQRAWLRNVRRHLSPGGALCFDVFQPDYRLMVEAAGPRTVIDRTDPATGLRVRRIEHAIPHLEMQKLEVHFQWLVEDASGAQVSSSSGSFFFRWFTRAELENLLELEGFRITDYWGSFSCETFGKGSQHQIIRAEARKD